MKKFLIVLSIALMGGGLLPLSMNAQNNNANEAVKTECASKEKCDKKGECDRKDKCDKKGKRDKKKGGDKKGKCCKHKKGSAAVEEQVNNKPGKGRTRGSNPIEKRAARDERTKIRPITKEQANPLMGIDLTDIQKEKIEKLRESNYKSMKKLEKDSHEKKDKIRKNFDKKLKGILTPTQYMQYEQNKSKEYKAKP